jgi:hypothetical protein
VIALGVISFFVLIVVILILIINALRRKSVKVWGIVAGSCLAIFFISSALTSPGPTSPTSTPVARPQISPTPDMPTISKTPTTTVAGIVISPNTPLSPPQISNAPSRTPTLPTSSVKPVPSIIPAMVSYILSDALEKNLIAIKINGNAGISFNGVSSGDVIAISFFRQKPETMKIVVPVGTSLVSGDSSKQNMVIFRLKGRDPTITSYTRVDEIILTKDDWQAFLFEAYCLDVSKGNIHSDTTFSVGGLASQEVTAVLNSASALGANTATTQSIQIAVWALTGNPSLADLRKRFAADDQSLAGTWAILEKAGLNPGSRKIFAGSSPNPSPTTATGTPPGGSTVSSPVPAIKAVTIDLVARTMAFDKRLIAVSPGAVVTINFNNMEAGIQHNFALYTDSSASKAVFVGKTITGPANIKYQFVVPVTLGNYFFRSDSYPGTMTGQFVVQ